ncbi:MAG: 50S ribosomal protein L1 [Candidatus Polarisedimenticolia bacterium]
MARHGRKYTEAAKQVEDKPYTVEQAVTLVKKMKFSKFDETLELALLLGVDPKHADQMVRGTVVLPHGTGKSKRVAVIASGEKLKEAETAGADHVGGKELVERIAGGWLEFESVVATPDMMKDVGRLGKVLGPKGLMPNPKSGTVTQDVAKAVREIKAGKLEFRVDKTAIIHCGVGKLSFDEKKLADNAHALLSAVMKAKPPTAKGKFLRSVFMSSTMGPSVRIDTAGAEAMGQATS